MIRKICKKATVWLLAGVIGLSAVTVQAAEVDNGASYPITTNAIEGWPQGPDTYSETAVLLDADTGTILYNKGMDEKRYLDCRKWCSYYQRFFIRRIENHSIPYKVCP